MKTSVLSLVFRLLPMLLLSLFGNTPLQAQGNTAYNVFRLAIPGAVSIGALDLNDSGNVIGDYLDANNNFYSFYYHHATRAYTSLGVDAHALGMNQSNQIVGYDGVWNIGRFWSSPTAAPIPLLPLPGHTNSKAYAVNNAGIIVGSSFIPEDPPVTPNYRATVVWRIDSQGVVTGPVVLPFPAGHLLGVPAKLTEMTNGVTTVVGHTSETTSSPDHAVQWSVSVDNAGVPVWVGGPTVLSSSYAYALSINDAKDVVGAAVFAGNVSQWPYLKRDGQTITKLPGIPKATFGAAYSINNSGQIVGRQGYLNRGYRVDRAVMWTSSTVVVDLNSKVRLGAGESLTWASRINTRGDILARTNGNVPCLLILK